MNEHRPENTSPRPKDWAPNRYAITLAALLASAEVPAAHQVAEQPAAPPHDYASGFDTTGNEGDGQGDARG